MPSAGETFLFRILEDSNWLNRCPKTAVSTYARPNQTFSSPPFKEATPSWEHRFVAGGAVHPYRAKHRKMTECAA